MRPHGRSTAISAALAAFSLPLKAPAARLLTMQVADRDARRYASDQAPDKVFSTSY
jgi:hypothetical protein